MSTRLLILGCSARKNPQPGLMHAIDRYRPGAYFQMLHQVPEDQRPDLVILSALYGYMNPLRLLPDYDFKMDSGSAQNLKEDPDHWGALKLLVKPHHIDIFIAAGKQYRDVINFHGRFGVFAPDATITYAYGGIGQQRSQLKKWLALRQAA